MAFFVTGVTALVPALTRRDLLPYGQAPYDLLGHLVGSAIPAFIVAAAVHGQLGVRDLLARCLRWRVGLGWYLVAIVGPVILTLVLAIALEGEAPVAALREDWPKLLTATLPSFLFAFVLSNFFEEIGWTGFLFDRLQGRHRPLSAATLVWLPFSLVHLPGFIVEGGSLTEGLLLLGFLAVPQLASRVIVAWIYNNSLRSLLLVGLFHSAYNVTTQNEFRETFLPISDDAQFLIYLVVPIIPALLIALFTKGRLGLNERQVDPIVA
jgi:membrane protease YdiL (CAAX protease family)